MELFKSLFWRNKPTKADILNIGLKYSMEFGKNWLRPIQDRLSRKFPQLSKSELDNFDEMCREVLSFSHNYIYERLELLSDKKETIPARKLKMELYELLKGKYDWISPSNLKGLFSQGIYYAWKDGLDASISYK